MTPQLEKEIQEIINHEKLNCTIEEFKDYVNWEYISCHENFSEEFIREFKDYVNWYYISHYQKLSEEFIREFKDYLDWYFISVYQKLSETLINEFKDYINWYFISVYQKLSEEFIKEFKEYVYWECVPKYQKLSEEFRKEFNIEIPKNNWLYISKEDKLKYIKENTEYEIVDDEYIIAYKSVRSDRYSVLNFQYQYLDGETYSSHCDCNIERESSFGLSAWTIEGAKDYYSIGKNLKVKIAIDKIGAIVHDNQKIRCFELTVIGEI